jgi:hypothetical protein
LSETADQVDDIGLGRKTSATELLKEKSSVEIKKILSSKVTDRVNSNLLRGINDSKIVEDTLKLFKDKTEQEARQER